MSKNALRPATPRDQQRYRPRATQHDRIFITDHATLPQGFRRISLVVTEKEYEELDRARIVSDRMTFSEVIRSRLGWSYQPYGFVKAISKIWRNY